MLKRDLPQGPGWLRYNWDGYGQRPDGGPFLGWGQGRVWPLLTGERAHYELAAGHDIAAAHRNLRKFRHRRPDDARAGVGRSQTGPSAACKLGQPAGSAVPLVWAHAEYLKLLRSAVDGKVFDRIDPVYERYCDAGRADKQLARDLEIYSLRRPIQKIAAGETLRILDEAQFRCRLVGRRLADDTYHLEPQPG